MLDAAKNVLARREALRAIRRRKPEPWEENPAKRRVLVVLPTAQDDAKAAWRFVQSLGVSHKLVTPVVPDTAVTYVPVEYIGRVHRLEGKHIGLLGVPRQEFVKKVWESGPDVAFCLHPEPDIASLYLVGASPAGLRVGLHSARDETFFDLMVEGKQDLADSLAMMYEALGRLKPSVFPFEGRGDALS